jgi:hypothetical protein
MTQIFNDNVEVTLTIDGQPWFLVDAEVELSRMDTPNYVDLLMVPDPDDTAPTLPNSIDNLIGSSFRLEADTDLISERDTDASEESLLFDGQLANISATGENSYEGIAYDPAQQAFAPEKDGGSLMNEFINLGQPEYSYPRMSGPDGGTQYEVQTIEATELAQQIVDELGIEEYEIGLVDGGVTLGEGDDADTFAYNRTIWISDTLITVESALTKLREWCEAEWWFDKEGVFHIGVPEPTKHELKYITDADAGKTTPPYQGVRVIGSGSASAEGYSRTNMEIEDKIVVEASIAIDEESGDPIANIGEIKSPVFEYQNLEVTNDEQARGTAKKLVEDLAEQQADGTVTVVGFPEVVPMDGIIMPNGEDGDYPDDDIRTDMPMGGVGYGVYKVIHRLNTSDGFITKIHCAGVTGVTATEVSSRQANTTYDVTNIGTGSRGLTAEERRLIRGAEPVR